MNRLAHMLAALALLAATAFAHEIGPNDTTIPTHGADPIPRFTKLCANTLTVPAGETFTLPAISEYDAIEVAGELRFSRDYDTTLRVQHFTVLAGGTVDCGTASDPILKRVEVVFVDQPIDPSADPYQWGNGLICLGRMTIHGRKIEQTWTTFAGCEAGATTLPVLNDWQDGDRLLIPDTRQIRWGRLKPIPKLDGETVPVRREADVTLAGGELSKPLDFEHEPIRWVDGSVCIEPYAANATRNIVFRSENPRGTRGHAVFLEGADVDARYFESIGMGRTQAVKLDSTRMVDGQLVIGTNQVGRYAWHFHHNHGLAALDRGTDKYTGHVVGAHFDGLDGAKWGLVIHGTHDMDVRQNVVERFIGAGIVTEDGYETRNEIVGNFVMGCKGMADNGSRTAKSVILAGNPGAEGSGIWLHGGANDVRGNVVANCFSGLTCVLIEPLSRPVPDAPGSATLVPFDARTALPVDFSQNTTFSCSRFGLDTWRLPSNATFVISDHTAANCGTQPLHFGFAETTGCTLERPRVCNQGGVGKGTGVNDAYVFNFKMYGARIEGCGIGVGSTRKQFIVEDSYFRCVKNIVFDDRAPTSTRLLNNSYDPLPGFADAGLVSDPFNVYVEQ